jgi:type II secretory pathway pseudopilin PulG
MRRAGLTPIEALIVILLIPALAAIVVPRLLGAGRQARETSLAADLYALRSAINLFEAQCGDYPAALGDLVASAAPAHGGNGVPLNPADGRGPYLTTPDGALPADPITGKRDWSYEQQTGEVHGASKAHALNGTRYRTW